MRGGLLCQLLGEALGGGGGLLVPGDLLLHVALRLERRVEGSLLLGPLPIGGRAKLRQLCLKDGQLLATRLEHRLLVARNGARIGEGTTPVLQRLAAGLELLADGADALGQDRVLVRDADEIADLGRCLVERVGREEHLEQRGLAALVG